MVSTSPQARTDTRVGTFHYLVPEVRSSLYRNGAVLTRRDRDGSDGGRVGVDLAPQDVGVVNARDLAGDDYRTLERSGFELLDQPLLNADIDFFSQEHVVNKYYGECAQIVQDATGAAKVFAFDHNVRSAAGKSSAKRISGGQQVQGPAHVVHGDYTLTSAPQRLRDLTKPPTGNDTFRALLDDGCTLVASDEADRALADGGRYAIINVWRNIADEPVQTNPLALCDARSVSPEDLVVFEIHYHDRIGENYFAKHTPQHRWFFYPEMTRDEALLIKQWDSAGAFARTAGDHGDASDAKAPCTFSFHSAFEDPLTPADAPERWSIEVRCVALYT